MGGQRDLGAGALSLGERIARALGGGEAAILAAAARADEIQIRAVPTIQGRRGEHRLARDRALSMRRLLIEGGIAADKLHLNSLQGEYIASNSTVEGRAQNRRVDVLFANYAKDRTPVAKNDATPEPGGPEPTSDR